jgi:hypothetical protein
MSEVGIIKEGYLKKKGHVNPKFQERRFVLIGNSLQYYDFKTMKGEIDLRGSVVSLTDEQKLLFTIDVGDRLYELQANSSKELNEWIQILKDYIILLPQKPLIKLSRRDKIKQKLTSRITNKAADDSSVSRLSSAERRHSKFASERAASPTHKESVREVSPTPTQPTTTTTNSLLGNETQRNTSAVSPPPQSNSPPSKPAPLTRISSFLKKDEGTTSPSLPKDELLTDIDKQNIVKQGRIKKKGEVNPTFKDRIFILTKDGQFSYYDDKMRKKGTIVLQNRSILVTSSQLFEWKLLPPTITSGEGREYILRAPTQQEMNEWLKVLNVWMENRNRFSRLPREDSHKSAVSLDNDTRSSSSPPPPPSLAESSLREGLLSKRGKHSTSRWKERRVLLFPTHILYCEGDEIKGKIELTPQHRVSLSNPSEYEFCISPPEVGGRSYFFRCKTRYDMDGWVGRIATCIQDIRSSRLHSRLDNADSSLENRTSPTPVSSTTSTTSSTETKTFHDISARTSTRMKSNSFSESTPQTPRSPQPAPTSSSSSSENSTSTPTTQPIALVLEELPVLEEITEIPVEDIDKEDEDTLPTCRPKWVPDETREKCTYCEIEFTFFFRRHHCRSCGRLLCGDCAPYFVQLTHLQYEEPVRVCLKCVDRFYRNAPKQSESSGCIIA